VYEYVQTYGESTWRRKVRSRRMVRTKKIGGEGGGGVCCPPSPFTKNFVLKKKTKRRK